VVAAIRSAAERGDVPAAWRLALGSDTTGAWRALRGAVAAGALPAAPPVGAPPWPPPRADEDHLLDARVAVRRGWPLAEVRAALAAHEARTLPTAGGPRAPVRALAIAPPTARFDLVAPLVAADRRTLRAQLRARLAAGDLEAATLLAELRHPEDVGVLVAARVEAGRRGDHVLLDALGRHGDPAAFAVLRAALQARDVDPGRGFVQRRLAADGLGRLGLGAGVPLLRRALHDERADFEGRPGAGLGVQYPVRANLLWALGEVGGAAAAPPLVDALGDTSGSAFGGFYLPAMDALVRVGPAAVPAVARCARRGGGDAAENAARLLRGPLAGLGTQ